MTATATTTATRLLGYARVSTGDQSTDTQLYDLAQAGVPARDTFADHGVSGAKTSRPGLDSLLDYAESGDVIVVTKLDRLGRSTAHVITLLDQLAARGVYVRVLDSGLDNSTITGKAMLQMLSVFADMEREFIRERTRAGLATAKREGRVGGRPPKVDTKRAALIQRMHDEGTSVTEIAATLSIARPTVYRYLTPKAEATPTP
ncbi:recombinase family protein [Pseudoclavibacter sp. Z016]|uniref:recombinase family protein n=1 Tax=Pseudoclavibacter sp. Z016 TaxID=2080581 RepID=UPI000CE8C2E1|nr:recombinase family protein [Pseudoclavibacter sp. Z016]PPF73379.1 invertase [Pseudoclavibacter sp. Z016]